MFSSRKEKLHTFVWSFVLALPIFPAPLPHAAGGRYSGVAGCAAVDKIEDQREPEDFIGHRKPDQSPAKYCRRR